LVDQSAKPGLRISKIDAVHVRNLTALIVTYEPTAAKRRDI
jgi:hypothetical protein